MQPAGPEPAADASPPSSEPSPAAPPGAGFLRRIALRASFFEMVGFGAGQVVRLGSNLVLSRLLFPEAFGLVALVNILNQGLQMLSDVGVEPAIIQSRRGEEPRFLNTAWTIQITRGLLLYGVAVMLAWPTARMYREPQLAWLTVVGSLSVVLGGLASTALITLRRRLSIGRLVAIELGAQAASVSVMVVWALIHPTVWLLVGGALVFALVRLVASHVVDVGYRNRIEVDHEARRSLADFGKWIFGASAVNFLSRQGDRLLLGRLLGVADLGIYSIAIMLSEAASTIILRITHGVLYPVFSRIHVEGEARLRDVYDRSRLALDALSLPALGLLTALGPWVVHVLYDARYAAAGWMLQAFAVRVAMSCVLIPCETCLFSLGQTRYGLYQNVARMIWVLVAIPIGWWLFGLRGLVYAAALSEVPLFFVLWPPFRAAGMFRLRSELRAAALFGAGLVAGALLSSVLRT